MVRARLVGGFKIARHIGNIEESAQLNVVTQAQVCIIALLAVPVPFLCHDKSEMRLKSKRSTLDWPQKAGVLLSLLSHPVHLYVTGMPMPPKSQGLGTLQERFPKLGLSEFGGPQC